jgi:L-aminopeptidase/D-esterase-like protein
MQGGIGTASVRVAGITVAALVAVNATGDVVDPATGEVIAGARRSATSLHLMRSQDALLRGELPERLKAGGATTIGVVATDAVLDKGQCAKLASIAHDGLARSIVPAHTPFDGDTLFALATGGSAQSVSLALVGALASEVTARAVLQAVRHAVSHAAPLDLPALRDLVNIA